MDKGDYAEKWELATKMVPSKCSREVVINLGLTMIDINYGVSYV